MFRMGPKSKGEQLDMTSGITHAQRCSVYDSAGRRHVSRHVVVACVHDHLCPVWHRKIAWNMASFVARDVGTALRKERATARTTWTLDGASRPRRHVRPTRACRESITPTRTRCRTLTEGPRTRRVEKEVGTLKVPVWDIRVGQKRC